MSIDKITTKILADAEEVRKMRLSEAERISKAKISEAEEQAARMLEEMISKGEEEKAKIIERRKSVAKIDSGKIFLKRKQELLDKCFDEAVSKIVNLPEDEYIDFLVNIGVASDMYGGVLTFNEKDRENVAAKVIEKLNKLTEKKRIDKYGDFPYTDRFSLREVSEPIRGGYWIRYRMTYADNTVESLVKLRKTQLAASVSKILFGED